MVGAGAPVSGGAFAVQPVEVASRCIAAGCRPGGLVLPDHVDDLEGWLIAILRTAEPEQMAAALSHAEGTAIGSGRFTGEQIVTSLRRVLACELSGD